MELALPVVTALIDSIVLVVVVSVLHLCIAVSIGHLLRLVAAVVLIIVAGLAVGCGLGRNELQKGVDEGGQVSNEGGAVFRVSRVAVLTETNVEQHIGLLGLDLSGRVQTLQDGQQGVVVPSVHDIGKVRLDRHGFTRFEHNGVGSGNLELSVVVCEFARTPRVVLGTLHEFGRQFGIARVLARQADRLDARKRGKKQRQNLHVEREINRKCNKD